METDNDAGANSVSVPDSSGTAGANPLTSATAAIAAPGAPAGTSPSNGLDGLNLVNGTITSYAALNSASVTAEGYFRTNEGTAGLIARTTGTKGYNIQNPNDVTVTFFVNNTQYVLSDTLPGGPIDLSVGTVAAPAYTKVTFSYDAGTGVASLLANDVLRGTLTVPGGGPMFVAGDNIAVSIGNDFDGGDNSGNLGGLIDDVRFLDTAVPEPGSLALVGVAAAGLLARRRGRRRA